jgi:hypothetical protein
MVYPVRSATIMDKDSKYIIVDYKPLYLSGVLSSKSRAVNKLFLEVSDHFPNYSDASIRRAIKDFFDFYK